MADKTDKTFDFTIGRRVIAVPELNLYASRVALRVLPPAFASNDPDAVIGGILDVLSALLEDHPDPNSRLTADQLQRQIKSDEAAGVNASMMALLKDSDFFEKGKAALATVTPPAPPSIPTPQSTESSSQSPGNSDAQTSDGSSAPGPSESIAPS